MGLIKITADMTESERTAVINTNMQYLQLSNRLRKYPIGMIVAFATDIDPNKLYGGTWERIKGRVIWGIDDGETAGSTGGEKTHTLTEAELPVIDGKFATAVVSQHGSKGVDGHAYGTTFPTVSDHIMATGTCAEQFGYGYKFGGNQPHNNMMPYYGAYVWRKTGHGIGEDPTLTEYEAFVQQMNTAISEALAKERLTTNATFSNALRGSASGSSVRLIDVSPNEHTLGVKVSSKNLMPYPYAGKTSTSNGITFTINSDGSVTANGTATAQAHLYLYNNSNVPNNFPVKANQNYTVSGLPSGSSATTYFIRLTTLIDSHSNDFYTGQLTHKLNISSDDHIKWAFIVIAKGTTVENLVFKPQVELGSTATAYTPYISDLTTVTVTRCGKNLTTPQQVYKGASLYSEEVFENKNCVRFLSSSTIENSPFVFKPNTQYTVSFDVKTILRSGQTTSGADNVFCFFYDDGTRSVIQNIYTQTDWVHKVLTSTVGKTVVAVGLYTVEYRSYSYVDIDSFQLEEGSTATEYEPYKMPTEYTPAVDGTVSGVKSLYPTTTLMTDTEGAIIEAEYNRDINKAFAELQQAILSMGGNT